MAAVDLPRINRIIYGSYYGSVIIWKPLAGFRGQWVLARRLEPQDAPSGALINGTDKSGDPDSTEEEEAFQVQFDDRRLFCCGWGYGVVGWDFRLPESPDISTKKLETFKHGVPSIYGPERIVTLCVYCQSS